MPTTTRYSVTLLDLDRNPLRVFRDAVNPQFRRRFNVATEFSVILPYGGTPAPADLVGSLAQLIEFRQDDRLVFAGLITKRGLTGRGITLEGLSEEILLSWKKSPAQYSRVFSNLDAADAIRLALRGWYTVRYASQAQWQAAIASNNIDTTLLPDRVLLTSTGNPLSFVGGGFITLRFDSQDFPGFHSWDRLRWFAGFNEVVTIRLSYRYGDSLPLTGNFSTPVPGGEPDTLGIVPGAATERYLEVRLDLATSDTTSVHDVPGNITLARGYSPVLDAVEAIARTDRVVEEGNIPARAGVTVRAIDADRKTQLQIIQAIAKQAELEFEVVGGQISVAAELGVDRTEEYTVRT